MSQILLVSQLRQNAGNQVVIKLNELRQSFAVTVNTRNSLIIHVVTHADVNKFHLTLNHETQKKNFKKKWLLNHSSFVLNVRCFHCKTSGRCY